jgi:hypothetical protein
VATLALNFLPAGDLQAAITPIATKPATATTALALALSVAIL